MYWGEGFPFNDEHVNVTVWYSAIFSLLIVSNGASGLTIVIKIDEQNVVVVMMIMFQFLGLT